MRRAVLFFAALIGAACQATLASAQHVEQASDIVDGVGMIDFTQRPDFKIGTWLKYHVTGSSLQGHKDDYTVTILVAGEEVWWGEAGVWIETWTQKAGQRQRATASLLSYSAFGDTMARKHVVWFMRKAINGTLPNGLPDISLYARDPNELKLRQANWDQNVDPVFTDSLGPDTTTVPAGPFRVQKVLERQQHTESAELADSTVFYQRRLDRTYYYTSEVPLTRFAKIVTDDHQQGKTWKAGQFDQSPLRTLERAQGETVLVGFGTSGLTPLLVPESVRRPIDRRLVNEALSLPEEPPVRPVRGSKGG